MKLKKLFRNMKFEIKLLLFNVLLVLVLLLGILAYFYAFVFSSEQDKAQRSLDTLAAKLGEQVDTVVYDMDRIALQLAANPYVIDVFANIPNHELSNYFVREPVYSSEIVAYLNTFNIKKNMTARICLYNAGGDFIYSGTRPTSTEALASYFDGETGEVQAVTEYFASGGNAFSLFISPRPDPFGENGGEEAAIFSVVRKIQDYSIIGGEAARGYVEVQQPMERLTELFGALDPGLAGYIIDEENSSVLWCSDGDTGTELSGIAARLEPGGSLLESGGQTWLATAVALGEMPVRVVLVQNRADVLGAMNSFWLLIAVVVFVLLCIIGITEYLVVRHLTKPLNQLHKSIDSVSIHHLEWKQEEESRVDEFTKLNSAFEQLFDKLQSSVDDLVASRTSELKSHLKALQAQMDPHFLHNTLTIISMTAAEQDYQRIEEICEKLSEILRYTASYKDTDVTLRQEVDNAVNYLDLMKIRYEERFDYSVEVEPGAEKLMVPKLVLQPLAENCFKHGFKGKRPPWHIGIKVMGNQKQWAVSISDNGTGFRREEIEAFEKTVARLEKENFTGSLTSLEIGKLCLVNIYIRLRLTYGDNMLFSIEENEDKGTTIVIGGVQL